MRATIELEPCAHGWRWNTTVRLTDPPPGKLAQEEVAMGVQPTIHDAAQRAADAAHWMTGPREAVREGDG